MNLALVLMLEEFKSWREIMNRVPEEAGGHRGKRGAAGNCSRPPWEYHKEAVFERGPKACSGLWPCLVEEVPLKTPSL